MCDVEYRNSSDGSVEKVTRGCREREACENRRKAPGSDLACKKIGKEYKCIKCGYGEEGRDWECSGSYT